MAILAVNAGSSSLKFSVFPLVEGEVLPSVLVGSIQGLEPAGNPLMEWSFDGQHHQRSLCVERDSAYSEALRSVAQLLIELPDVLDLKAVVHRVVHGGGEFSTSVVVDDDVLKRLARFNSLAPLHQPHNLEGIYAFRKTFPDIPHVACFDTAFHCTLSEVEVRFALPAYFADIGVRRYGFHGLSYQYIMGCLQACTDRANGRVLMAHLGNGASVCAAREGRSCATSMGFSALDGLMMGTRCGALDAGVLLYLLEQGWSRDRIERLLYKESGLLGVSGLSADMRKLRADSSLPARLAIEMFTYRLIKEAGAMIACLGGLDVLAFSGGIGEHDVQLRADVCQRLAWMGVRLDAAANAEATGDRIVAIHAPDSAIEVWVVPTDEGLMAAREAARLLEHSERSNVVAISGETLKMPSWVSSGEQNSTA